MMNSRNRNCALVILVALVVTVGFFVFGTGGGRSVVDRVNVSSHRGSTGQRTGDSHGSKTNGEAGDLIGKFKDLSNSGLPYPELRLKRKMLVLAISERLGFDAAMSIIDEEVGPGAEKSLLMSTVFMGVRESVEVSMSRLSRLSEQERGFAVAGLLERIGHQKLAESEAVKIVASDEVFKERKSISMILTVGLTNEGSPLQAKEELAKWQRRIDSASPENRQALLLSVVDGVSAVYPYEAWKFLSELGLLGSGAPESKEFSSTVEKMAGRMFDSDPKRSMEMFLDMGEDGARYLNGSFRQWMKMSSKAASDWCSSVSANLSGSQRDALSSGVADYYSSSGDFEAAWSRLAEIQDPAEKKKAEGVVWERERQQVIREVKSHPEQFIGSMISEGSPHASYWIEEAMFTWASSDFEKAVAWNEEHWKSLPASKSQFVAAAFATFSLKQQDIDAARQWASLIEDAKTKARIDAAIVKASGAK